MDGLEQQFPRQRKAPKTRKDIFKEDQLPANIIVASLILILALVIGKVSGNVKAKNKIEQQVQAAQQKETSDQNTESYDLLAEAEALAKDYDFDGAIAKIDSFSGNIEDYKHLISKRDEYMQLKSQMVAWDDPSEIVNLTFQMLIADPTRAYNDDLFSYSFTRNFLNVAEFTTILERLYKNGYILVSPDDYIEKVVTASGTTYKTKTIYLPEGKKPLVLTQTNVNYHTYLIDGDGDKKPDKGGCGFASKLVFDENGELTCEYINAEGEVLTGMYDMIPILNEFVDQHPDFSLRGAKAVIALTGYDGLFGYRTNPSAKSVFGADAYDAEIAMAKQVAEALRNDGYTLACYTYENDSYKDFTATQIKAEMNCWAQEANPILGEIDIFVFAQNGDIEEANAPYSGEKYKILHDLGFGIYFGFCTEGEKWFVDGTDHIRQGRLTLSPNTLAHYSEWFSGIISTDEILDPSRGNIPM